MRGLRDSHLSTRPLRAGHPSPPASCKHRPLSTKSRPDQSRVVSFSTFSFNSKARISQASSRPSIATSSISQFKIALCQLSVTADKERKIAHARKGIEEAAEKGAQLVLLPG
ncbi:hypothetical protein MRB53_023420 [Persea americana]|uniref:Uncharacterized protein n=1 Tax=Persea americana TaxID=3435 RepID=A0ACC2L9Q8_PERAE|nr:hypothetical protein MRB53_023420 [Persea americana]